MPNKEAQTLNPQPLPEGVKFDKGKIRMDLLPVDALWETARVYTIGANKYDDRNWEKGVSFGRIFGALLRHAFKWWAGERNDPEDGQHHLSSVAWCALTLLHYDLNPEKYITFDDRVVDDVKPWTKYICETGCNEKGT